MRSRTLDLDQKYRNLNGAGIALLRFKWMDGQMLGLFITCRIVLLICWRTICIILWACHSFGVVRTVVIWDVGSLEFDDFIMCGDIWFLQAWWDDRCSQSNSPALLSTTGPTYKYDLLLGTVPNSLDNHHIPNVFELVMCELGPWHNGWGYAFYHGDYRVLSHGEFSVEVITMELLDKE